MVHSQQKNTFQVDSELFQQAQQGNAQAIEQLLTFVQPQLYRYSMQMCRHPEDAEDNLQDVLLAVARSISTYRGDASFSTWLYTIARNACAKRRKRERTAAALHEDMTTAIENVTENTPGPEEQIALAEQINNLHDAMQRLAPEYREIMILRDVQDLSAKDVAAITGLSIPAVKSRLHRARALVRQWLAEKPYEQQPNCPDIRTLFSQHLEGDLADDFCANMQKHVDSCPHCAAECEGLRDILHTCKEYSCDLPPSSQRRIRNSIRTTLNS